MHHLASNCAPGGLRVALGSRPNARPISEGVPKSTPIMQINARDLRFREEETIEFVRQALGDRGGPDLAIRIHALTAGWPMGVRLAVASQLRNAAPRDLDVSVSADIARYFLDRVINRLPEAVGRMLVGLARFDPIHPDLCRRALGPDTPVHELERLSDQTAILTRDEGDGWLRLHPTAREILAQRQQTLPENEHREIAIRASNWYADRNLFEEGAHQASLAGDRAGAVRLIETSLRTMTQQGRSSEVLDWFNRMSPEEIREHPRFWAPAAWALAMSSRMSEARALIEQILHRPETTNEERYEAELILSTTAAYGDDLSLLDELVRKWPAPLPSAPPGEIVIHAVAVAHRALLLGQTEQVRQILASHDQDPQAISPLPGSFVELFVGLSYLWEGRPQIAYEVLSEALTRGERQLDRWNRVLAMIAAALGQACLEMGRFAEARKHLALRLPILEQRGLPDTIISGYVVLAEIADEEGRQDQAAVQYASLAALGRERRIPRMEAAGYRGLAELHARHGRSRSAGLEHEKVATLCAALPAGAPTATRLWCDLHEQLARAAALVGETNPERLLEAEDAASKASRLAARLNRGSETVRALFLHAQALQKLDKPGAEAEHAEASSLCRASGMSRLQAKFTESNGGAKAASQINRSGELPLGAAPDSRSILTPREYEILYRLVTHMSNKEIAISMDLSEETVKWHLKNLFQKLGAGDRKNAVRRAQALGVLR